MFFRSRLTVPLLIVPLLLVFLLLGASASSGFEGTWTLVEARSTSVDPWHNLSLEMQIRTDRVVIKRIWSGNREAGRYVDSTMARPGGPSTTTPMERWPDNPHIGAFLAGDSTKQVTAQWLDDGRTLQTTTRLQVSTSQGVRPIRIYSEYRLAPDGNHLTLLELRSTRPRPLRYTFERSAAQ